MPDPTHAFAFPPIHVVLTDNVDLTIQPHANGETALRLSGVCVRLCPSERDALLRALGASLDASHYMELADGLRAHEQPWHGLTVSPLRSSDA